MMDMYMVGVLLASFGSLYGLIAWCYKQEDL